MGAHNLPLESARALSGGFYSVKDPGDAGTMNPGKVSGFNICEVVTAGAETRVLPSATGLGVGTCFIVTLKTDGGDLTIQGNVGDDVILDDAGEVAYFIVSDADGTKGWERLVAVVSATGPTFDANGTADAFILDADGDTTLSSDTDDTINIEVSGADDFTITANSFNVLTGSAIDLADSCQIKFGTGDDITMAWDGTDFDILQAGTDSSIKVGIDGAGMDLVLYGDTLSSNATWDQSADTLILNAANLLLATSGTVDLAGIADALVLDADNDTTISAPTDDQIDIEVGGADVLVLTATALTFAATCFPVLPITDTDGTVEASIWYDASEDKLKFKTAAGVETVTSA